MTSAVLEIGKEGTQRFGERLLAHRLHQEGVTTGIGLADLICRHHQHPHLVVATAPANGLTDGESRHVWEVVVEQQERRAFLHQAQGFAPRSSSDDRETKTLEHHRKHESQQFVVVDNHRLAT